jgi:monodehydroascorbate reductase (NADH)
MLEVHRLVTRSHLSSFVCSLEKLGNHQRLFGKGVSAPKVKGSTRLSSVCKRCLVMSATAVKSYEYVILGGGNAAGYAARQFVEKHGLSGHKLAVISRESVAPYERPALSKAYLTANPPTRLPAFHTCVAGGGAPQTPDWYAKNGIDLLLSTEIVDCDLNSKCLTAKDGSKYGYGKLLIATGSDALHLDELGMQGAHLGGIHYLREIAEADKLYEAMKACAGKHAVVVGGGYIGLECTAALVINGVRVTMVFPEPHVMARLFTPEIAAHYERIYAQKGVNFIKGTVVDSFADENGSGQVKYVRLKNGPVLEADLVVVGVGAKPRTTLLEGALAMEARGIKVDGHLRTSHADVFGAGDVITFPLKMYGNRMARVEHVGHARQSAMHAVDVMMGATTEPYDYLPFFYSRVFHLSWKFWGDTPAQAKTIVVGEMNPKLVAVWIDQDGHVVGTFIESGTEHDENKLKELARTRPKANVARLEEAAAANDVDGFLNAL